MKMATPNIGYIKWLAQSECSVPTVNTSEFEFYVDQ